MIDDPETPKTRPNGEIEPNVQRDDHGQRQETQEQEVEERQQGTDRRLAIEDIKEAIPEAVEANPEVTKWSREFIYNWTSCFRERFQPKHALVLNAIHSVEAYDEYIGIKKRELMKKKDLSEKALESSKESFYKELSAEIERDIVLTISELYILVDEASPDQTFEDIINADFMKSIKINFDTILNKLNLLRNNISAAAQKDTVPENLKEIKFFKKYSEQEVKETILNPKAGKERTVYAHRPVPTARLKETSPEDFIRYVNKQTNHYMSLRRYLHNVSVIFKRGKGEHGFWAQVAEYAKQMTSTDIDNLPLLPDADLFMTAHGLYIKHLTQEMAKVSWIHQPGMFSEDFFEYHTDIEERVLEDLKRLFPNITREDGWRIDRAVKMGVQIARGVTLAEVEIAASADPAIKINSDGTEVTYESFYIADSSALTAFRPTYNAERFLPPDMMRGPIFYSPVSDFKKERFWDHRKLWEKMNQYRDSYIHGRGKLNLGEDEVILLDAMSNFGGVGGVEYRSGWRFPRGYDAWLIKKEVNGQETEELNFLESWKQLENIGFVILKNFVSQYVTVDEGKKFLEGEGRKIERRNFLEYLNKEFINYDTGKSLDDEITEIKTVLKKKNEDEDVYKFLINKALYGVIRRRIPTMFIRLDRDRMEMDGRGAYEKIRRNIAQKEWTTDRLDKAFRNLETVEAKLRLDVSKKMSEYLQSHDKDLRDPSIRYMVTEKLIRESLSQMLTKQEIDEGQIDNAVLLFKHIDREYLSPDTQFAKERIDMLYENKFAYSLATEELDSSFVAYRAAGNTVLYRALNDIAQIEQNAAELVQKHIDILKQVSIDPKQDMSPLIQNLFEIRKQISVLHGDGPAFKQVSYLVGLTINYFKKDFMGKAFWGLLGVGRRNSIAAEFAGGTSRGVWEWDNPEIDRFIVECERMRILPRDPSELKLEPKIIPKSFLGFKYNKVEPKIGKPILTGKEARKLFGATKADLIKGYMWKYLPIIFAVLLWSSMAKAFKKEITGKEQ